MLNHITMKNRSGQAMVEFAMTLPLLALLLFAIIQYGFIFGAYMTLRHGAHAAARSASLAGADTGTSNITAVASSSITPMLDPVNLQSVDITSTTVGGLAAYTVQLNYNLPLIIKYVVPNATGNILALKANATYRKN